MRKLVRTPKISLAGWSGGLDITPGRIPGRSPPRIPPPPLLALPVADAEVFRKGRDLLTYSDPFGLCPDPEPCKVRFVALSGSAALAHIGFNFEIGIGRGTDKGRFVFAKIGPSAGVGVSISIEGGVQYSTTDEFLGNPDGRTVVAGEIEALLLNIPLDVSPEGNWKPTGWGVNIGPGFLLD